MTILRRAAPSLALVALLAGCANYTIAGTAVPVGGQRPIDTSPPYVSTCEVTLDDKPQVPVPTPAGNR